MRNTNSWENPFGTGSKKECNSRDSFNWHWLKGYGLHLTTYIYVSLCVPIHFFQKLSRFKQIYEGTKNRPYFPSSEYTSAFPVKKPYMIQPLVGSKHLLFPPYLPIFSYYWGKWGCVVGRPFITSWYLSCN